jgi:MFS family permease
VATTTTTPGPARGGTAMALVAWLVTALYFFYQYALRSAPAVMMPDLSTAFGLSTAGVASLLGMFYYGYSPFSLVAGAALDRFGARSAIPVGALTLGVGALLFGTGHPALAYLGRFLQGVGGAVAFIGAVYIVSRSFAPSSAATLIGATQMFGMAGGSAGQFVVGPIIASGVSWQQFWLAMGAAGVVMAVLLFFLIPAEKVSGNADWLAGAGRSLARVFRNRQSLLCGAIAGLLFIPTTIFDMVWGVRYLQDAHGLAYGEAVVRSSMVPLGWIVGCPLLGFISDRLGRRKPVVFGGGVVLLACLAWILFGIHGVLPPYVVGLVAGIASGAAVLPTTISKESNPPELAGTSTGVVNFLNFTFSALLGPVFAHVLTNASGGATTMTLEHYQFAFQPMLVAVGLAIVLTWFLRETGPAARVSGASG